MTATIMQSGQEIDRPGIPRISTAEWNVMQAAAARLLGRRNAEKVADEMQALTECADAQAAGSVSQGRNSYRRANGMHMMAMPYAP